MSSRTAVGVTACALLSTGLLAGCGGTSTSPPAASSHAITVKFALIDTNGGSGCEGGSGGYSDIGPSTNVTVYDDSGKVIATGELGDNCSSPTAGGQTDTAESDWTATVANVPTTAFYQVEVGNRGKLRFSKAQLAAAGWTVHASLGGS